MKSLKLISFALASLMAISLAGCGKQEDPKVRFLRECKESLTPDECQQLAYNKSLEEQARLMRDSNRIQQGYVAPPTDNYGQPAYGAPVVQPQSGGSFMDSAAGAVVGGVAGAVIGNAITNRSADRDYDRNRYNRQQSQERTPVKSYSAPAPRPSSQASSFNAPKQTVTAPRSGAFSRPSSTSSYKAPKQSYQAPKASSRPTKSAFSR